MTNEWLTEAGIVTENKNIDHHVRLVATHMINNYTPVPMELYDIPEHDPNSDDATELAAAESQD